MGFSCVHVLSPGRTAGITDTYCFVWLKCELWECKPRASCFTCCTISLALLTVFFLCFPLKTFVNVFVCICAIHMCHGCVCVCYTYVPWLYVCVLSIRATVVCVCVCVRLGQRASLRGIDSLPSLCGSWDQTLVVRLRGQWVMPALINKFLSRESRALDVSSGILFHFGSLVCFSVAVLSTQTETAGGWESFFIFTLLSPKEQEQEAGTEADPAEDD